MSTTHVAHEHSTLRDATPGDTTVIEALWQASQDVDDRAFRPRDGWWSLTQWAQHLHLLVDDTKPIGVMALAIASDRAAEVRLALAPDARTPRAARTLLLGAIAWVQAHHLPRIRLVTPAAARWATDVAIPMGFRSERSFQIMLRSPSAPPLATSLPSNLHIRPMHAGEAPAVLNALNHAWADTWNFQPLTLDVLLADLDNQPEGLLVAVDSRDDSPIAGTVHAMFEPQSANPDGAPFAWISNLTTGPAWRGRGLGRALLAAGIKRLQAQGARSIALGVDTGNPAPLALYESAGFVTSDRLIFWRYTLAEH
jgi:ribosomal protein S18 acetylase RimI-like enzyme